MSYKLIEKLESQSIAAVHVKDALSVYAMDQDIWDHALSNDLVILTKDSDFDELSQLYGCPPKVVHLLCGNNSTEFIFQLISHYKDDIIDFVANDHENCLLKLTG
ncbi:DUF5615 family PIN-like protein [Gracilimonas mengyeensis]|uniref:DUF5615 family PIN-like protein n=1 Tax=Gracilimonas mengyeensis TaxID=1302730 RepID=UPI0011573514|nr:DUF5615 family PIN-like protein [Gracilimonas mengyeensis]